MKDNLLSATSSMRSALSTLRRKVSRVKMDLEALGTDLDCLDAKIEKLVTESEVYKNKLSRETSRETRRLQKELNLLRKSAQSLAPTPVSEAPEEELNIASTLAVFESVLRAISERAEDFRLLSESFLFPAVYERVSKSVEEAYFLHEVPDSAAIVVARGREYLSWIREQHDTYLTTPDVWEEVKGPVCDWWRNDALPLLYGARDEQWDIDEPLSLTEMLIWRDSPSERPDHFPLIFDAYEIYRKNKDQVYESSGVRQFDLKMFSFEESK